MIKEITVKTALLTSKLPGLDYALNPYRGCEHACIYCYAPSVIHWNKGKWGELVEAKVNMPRILSKELRTKKRGVIGLGTVTDPYQPAESKYEITRRCLELLQMHDFPVCIQTKSSLVLRDMELLKKFSNIEVGVTLTTLDDSIREKLEPGASGVKNRVNALSELSKNGIKTWVFLGPVIPYITDVEAMVDAVASTGSAYILMDKLRPREGVYERVLEFIEGHKHEALKDHKIIMLKLEDYYNDVFMRGLKRCGEKKIRCEINRI